MTWTLSDNGTTSALTIGTETTLATDTNNGTFVLEVDASNMTVGDWLIVRAYTISLSGGSLTKAWEGAYQHVQATKIVCPPVASDQSIEFTLTQNAGTIPITWHAGTVADSIVGTGQTTGATALIRPLGAISIVSGVTTTVVQMISGAFNSSENVYCTTASNYFSMNGAPTGRTFKWKALRV